MKTINYDENEWVLVPKVPTKEMYEAGIIARRQSPTNINPSADAWPAMIQAAPKPPEIEHDPAEFERGVRAVLDYMLMRTSNNFHGNPEIQKTCDMENSVIESWINDAIEEISPDSYREWRKINELCAEIKQLKSQKPAIDSGKVREIVSECIGEVTTDVMNGRVVAYDEEADFFTNKILMLVSEGQKS